MCKLSTDCDRIPQAPDLQSVRFLWGLSLFEYSKGAIRRAALISEVIQEWVGLHLKAFFANSYLGGPFVDVSEKLARNTCHRMKDLCLAAQSYSVFFDRIRSLSTLGSVYLDPVEEPLCEVISRLSGIKQQPRIAGKTKSAAQALASATADRVLWLDQSVNLTVQFRLQELQSALEKSLKGGK